MESKEIVNKLLHKLRSRSSVIENKSLDIKGEWYSNTKKKNWKFEFAKDVCAMANSLSSRECHLIFGLTNREPFLRNVEILEDEAVLQQIIQSNVTPIPKIKLDKVIIEGYSIYVLSIRKSKKDMAYFASRPNRDQLIYIRRGSSTGLCTKSELDQILEVKREEELSIQIESQAIKSVKDIHHKLKISSIENISPILNDLDQYSFDYSFRVSSEVLYTLRDVVHMLRFEENKELIKRVVDISSKACHLNSLVRSLNHKVSDRHLELISQGLDLGHEIGYRAIRRDVSEKMFGAAVLLLHRILRFTILNKLSSTKKEVLHVFLRLNELALNNNYADASKWLQFNIDDAEAINGRELPALHADLLDKFS